MLVDRGVVLYWKLEVRGGKRVKMHQSVDVKGPCREKVAHLRCAGGVECWGVLWVDDESGHV